MDEQTQQEFITWLSEQLGIESEDQLEAQMNEMGDDGIKEAFDVFQKERGVQSAQEGGKLEYLKKLQQGGSLGRGGTAAVAKYQQMLNQKYGLKLAVDGVWGKQTQSVYEYHQNMAKDPSLGKIALPFPKENLLQNIVQNPNFLKRDKLAATPATNPMDKKLAVASPYPKEYNPNTVYPMADYHKKGGAITGKISDKGEDKASATGGRMDKGTQQKTALKKLTTKKTADKTAVGVTNWLKGKDSKNALNGRKEK